jgi:hypothetical protein
MRKTLKNVAQWTLIGLAAVAYGALMGVVAWTCGTSPVVVNAWINQNDEDED